MTEYEKLLQNDWVRVFEHSMDMGTVKYDKNNKFYSRQIFSKNNPWVYNPFMAKNKPFSSVCNVAHDYFFAQLSCIYSRCHNCYKVVVKPDNFSQLWRISELQETMDRPCKAGIEIRATVPRLYGAYFYNNSLEKGKECYKIIRELVNKELGEGVKVILKRGCTEFEIAFGASDKWQLLENQDRVEADFWKQYIEEDEMSDHTPETLIAYRKRVWMHWASDHRDPTVLPFIGGKWLASGMYYREFQKPYLSPKCKQVTYHD